MSEKLRVEALALHEIGVFDDVSLEFKPIAVPYIAEVHVFTGPNGCGKSTLLYALAEIFNDTSNGFLPLLTLRLRNQFSTVDFLLNSSAGQYGVLKSNTHIPCRFGQPQRGFYIDPDHSPIFFRYADQIKLETYKPLQSKNTYSELESMLLLSKKGVSYSAFSYSGMRTIDSANIQAIQPITGSPFDQGLSFIKSVRPQNILQWIANNRTQAALALADGNAQENNQYNQALFRITNFVKEICDLDIEFKLERSPLAVKIRVNGDVIEFDGLPDGLKSIISWVADLSLRLENIPWQNQDRDIFSQRIILFLDEIDIHLHPKWQRKVLPAVQKLLPNAQIFVSTHSPFVVGSVKNAWIYRLPEAGSGAKTIEGIPSGAGKSYQLILQEVFDIDDEFDVETEQYFDAFYQQRNDFLNAPNDPQTLLEAARKVADRGEEAKLIISRELKQISRLTGKELSLA